MRFMLLMYPNPKAEQGAMPDAAMISAMMKYNEELAKAGVLLSLDGLQSSAKGARVTFPDGKPRVIDGPFTETKEILGGYWILQVKSKAEAVEWAKRCPDTGAQWIEVRQIFEMSDFGPDIAAQESALAKEIEKGMAQNAKR